MQALSPEQYARLRELAGTWTRCHLKAAKHDARFNPRLTADALCFRCQGEYLLGALITPLSLSLVLLPDEESPPPPPEQGTRRVSLPSGTYGFRAESLDETLWLWRCELLDDLSDVASRQEASRLAQQLMERVMAPAAPGG
ncbi:[NiFe]-hydrogenase assembly chaperone HybE [Halomonas sp. EGI 63088]|uniref:[NiFe]-hydrogenase assembly chaperone HybE n=1 Tax=Halomonas flagellata TaxID=2920385 RepID=A0ABS9RSR6_9GAMM|nr:[NiFe]-hydrogenase assembly chaperone HybE [Halomonas flagellata]MCH4562895.1 [NiFe]-hydrogenase assembly chaperone HybE [Halomonas flagellata]